uniref:Uncharacterized protein n=1 Tax=Aquisalinus luteolus TaxID=1566827 RepID=A0A8J3A4I6_9PROT|nr:hypothetical protein GCM10011355_00210 [Aquisalinus luteolus]
MIAVSKLFELPSKNKKYRERRSGNDAECCSTEIVLLQFEFNFWIFLERKVRLFPVVKWLVCVTSVAIGAAKPGVAMSAPALWK